MLDGRPLARQDHAAVHELLQRRDAEARARRPVRDVEIAQPADAVFHVGLEQVHRAAVALAALADARRRAAPGICRCCAMPKSPSNARFSILSLSVRSPVTTRQSSSVVAVGRSVCASSTHLVRRDDLVTDVEPGVPERIEQRFGDRTHACRRARS